MLEFMTFVMPLVQAAALSVARPLGLIIVFPLFSWLGLQGMIRNTFALAIAVPHITVVYTTLAGYADPLPLSYLTLLAGKEFLIGVLLAVMLGVPFWAAEVAGAYVDTFRGSMTAVVSSPGQDQQMTSGALFSIALVAIFVAAGGLRTVIGALYDTYEIWPIFEIAPAMGGDMRAVFIGIIAEIARISLTLAAPLLIAMFIGEMALAYASKFATQVNVFDAALSVKNLIFLMILPPYVYLLTRYYGPDVLDFAVLTGFLQDLAGK